MITRDTIIALMRAEKHERLPSCIYCRGCGCRWNYSDSDTYVRAFTEGGWAITDGGWYCPDCAA